jgi:hypothetical protein
MPSVPFFDMYALDSTGPGWVTIPVSTGMGPVVTVHLIENVPVGHTFLIGAYGMSEVCHNPECPETRCILRRVMES